ncbi:MAG: response regulator [Magnetococcales bacterium]|nr:response regulator [Magnetococcales bacterium]
MNILIVDDQVIYRETLRAMLEPHGKCVVAEDGVQAVQAFQNALEANNPFQLVLLDIQMPNLDGQGALLQMRQLEKQKFGVMLTAHQYAHIIMQTSLDSPAQLTTAFKEGRCNGYIVKPVDEDELLERLRRHGLL